MSEKTDPTPKAKARIFRLPDSSHEPGDLEYITMGKELDGATLEAIAKEWGVSDVLAMMGDPLPTPGGKCEIFYVDRVKGWSLGYSMPGGGGGE